jgi:hypothetical protein
MQILISLLLGSVGIGRKFPIITGLLLLFAATLTWNFFENRSIARDAVREAQREAITKDTQENKELQRAAEADQEQHEIEVKEATEQQEKDIADIETLKPHQCLDVKLSDIGLR